MGKIQDFLVVMALVIALANAQSVDVCVKDVLILLDTSISIGERNFINKIKPFLEELGRNSDLGVSPQGSHIAILTFSSVKQTRIRLSFNQGFGVSYHNTVDGFTWKNIEGGHTRTDVAFQKAGEIFKDQSPLNHRSQYDDMILLITDGEPHGVEHAKEKAIAEAQKLKDRGVLIIGLGVGAVNMETLRAISSPGQAIMATFTNIHTKLERLVTASCQVAAALSCTCPAVELGDFVIQAGSSARVSWDIPQPNCPNNVVFSLMSVVPNSHPGKLFSAGRHNIEYTYNVSGATSSRVKCDISFEVKGTQLCGGKAYSTGQVCCCGQIHDSKENHQCCGTDYFLNSTHKCCPGSTVRNKDQSCFGLACKCPAVNLDTKYMKEGDGTTSVTWAVPRPTCGGRLRTIMKPDMRPGQMFAPGVYSLDYVYQTINLIDVTCTVRFEVKECSCPLPILKTYKVTPGETTTAVTWTVPQPTCFDDVTNAAVSPQVQPGELFDIGQHTVIYTYNIKKQFDVRCAVMIEVKGALCRNRGYNPTNQACCCGTVYNTIPGYDCCGQDYHSLTTHHCCANSVVRDKAVACPRQ